MCLLGATRVMICRCSETDLLDLSFPNCTLMIQVIPTDKVGVEPLKMPDRFRKEIVYFMSPAEGEGAPKLGKDEYWIRATDAARWLEDGVFTLVSPLDAESVAEIELSEDQEIWLEWMVEHKICTVRIAQ